ncbi:MAG: hypothetical protein JWO03_1836 [Bacteroidetes bacterium]|nr:hypothetical protein [Bacteroidota bacterium]
MQEKDLFEYAVIRTVPRVEREEFLNVGVVLFCRNQNFLKAVFDINEERIRAFSPNINMEQVGEYLLAFRQICAGHASAGPISQLPMAERFRWLTAPRSTILQTSRVHSGFCSDAEDKLNKLHEQLVLINESDSNVATRDLV